MDTIVLAAVLAAALLHAGWNALVKVGLDPFSSILLLALVQGGLALALLALFPVPAAASWPWLVASALLALDAQVRLRGKGGARMVPIGEFFTLPTQDRRHSGRLRRRRGGCACGPSADDP